MDLKNIFGEVIFSCAVDTIKELVVEAVKKRANLSSANLYNADLSSANLVCYVLPSLCEGRPKRTRVSF